MRRKESERLPYVHCERPRCDDCGSPELRTYRTVEKTEEAASRYVQCQRCEKRFILVQE